MLDLPALLSHPGVSDAMLSVLLALVALLVAFLGMLTRRLNAVKHQVVNDHGPDGSKEDNLRDQVDRIETTLRDGLSRIDHQYGELHTVVTQEVKDRQALEERMNYGNARVWKKLDKLAEFHENC